MSKRKRAAEEAPSVLSILDTAHTEIARALKEAKGFERQRLSKRFHERSRGGRNRNPAEEAERKNRIEREIAVLKSLDLNQTARAHLYSSLLRVKALAESEDLPVEVRRGVSKPQLPEQEMVALHNITSGLYNKDPVKQAVARAVEAACGSLGVAVPEKRTKRQRKDKREEQEEQPSDRIAENGQLDDTSPEGETVAIASVVGKQGQMDEEEEEEEEETDFEGFESDVDEPGSVLGQSDSEVEAQEEDQVSAFGDRLGGSSDEEDEFDEETLAKYRGREQVDLDDISLSGSASDLGEFDEGEEADSEAEAQPEKTNLPPARSLSPSANSSSKRERKAEKAEKPEKTEKTKKAKKDAKSAVTSTTFLPSLMGGYISGSESASDIEDEIAAPKKRRGQKARQAIWEQKYGTKAKHLQNPASQGKGRDAGWDMKRGAVDGTNSRTPWKKGVISPFATQSDSAQAEQKPPKPRKKDDEGVLHASWEAKRKAKEQQQKATFSGSKIVFD